MAVDENIKKKANDIRTKTYGAEVRESLASGIEAISEDVEETIGRQDFVEYQFQTVIDETTGKDVISAPELIAARNGKSNLKTRLDEEHAQVNAQLQHKASKSEVLDFLGNVSDGTPLFADGIDTMTHVSRNYVNIADGMLYAHDGSNWINTGVRYQETGISTSVKSILEYKFSPNLLDTREINDTRYNTSTALVEFSEGHKTYGLLNVRPDTEYTISNFTELNVIELGMGAQSIRWVHGYIGSAYTFTTKSDTYHLAITVLISDRAQLEIGAVANEFSEPYAIKNLNVPKIQELEYSILDYIPLKISPNLLPAISSAFAESGYNTTTGAVEPTGGNTRFAKEKVFGGKHYTLSGDYYGYNLVEFSNVGTVTGVKLGTENPVTILTDENTSEIGVVVNSGTNAVQLELGKKATPYKPRHQVDNFSVGGYFKGYESGQINFTVPVNKFISDLTNTSDTLNDELSISEVPCVLMLPTSYKSTGNPTKLLMICHGSSGGVSDGSWFGNNESFLEFIQKLLNAGYAVFDCNGYEAGYNGQEHWGSDNALQGYRKAYEYVVKNYNVTKDFSVYGFSMGGLTALNYVFQNANNVKCVALGSPVVDLKTQVWDSGVFSKNDVAASYGFSSPSIYDTEKTVGNDPTKSIITFDGSEYVFKNLPPLKIWHGTNDVSVPVSHTERFVNAIRKNDGSATIRKVSGAGHEICWGANGNVNEEIALWLNRFN